MTKHGCAISGVNDLIQTRLVCRLKLIFKIQVKCEQHVKKGKTINKFKFKKVEVLTIEPRK